MVKCQGKSLRISIKGPYLITFLRSVPRKVVPMVVSHHKHFMTGTEDRANEMKNILLDARIIAVADVFNAMTTNRPYRKGMPPWQALEEIVKNMGFHPEVVEGPKGSLARKWKMLDPLYCTTAMWCFSKSNNLLFEDQIETGSFVLSMDCIGYSRFWEFSKHPQDIEVVFLAASRP